MVFITWACRTAFAYHMPFPSYSIRHAYGVRVSYMVKRENAEALLASYHRYNFDDGNIGHVAYHYRDIYCHGCYIYTWWKFRYLHDPSGTEAYHFEKITQ